MKLRPMLQVRDVATASRWYQQSLGLTSRHGGDEYEMLFDGDEFVLQLHRLDASEHGVLPGSTDGDLGAGVSLWFEFADRAAFDAAVDKARAAGATIVREPAWNPLAHHHEAALVDADGYVVILHSPFELPG
jgi:catechol 2,3-dioxygenase-like lactoylglutathione lyase family enzyme